VVCNVPVAEAINEETVLPERVQDALGQLFGAAKEGLLALSVEVGLGVLGALLRRRSRRSSGRRDAGTATGPRSGTATRMARSRSAGDAFRSSAPGCAQRMARAR
jgi:hypothetical protein